MDNKLTGQLESMIIMLMDGNNSIKTNAKNGNKDIVALGNKYKKHEYVSYDISEMVKCCDMSPESAYAVNIAIDQDRQFATKPEWLMNHPLDIIGEGLEVALFHNNMIKWVGYRKCKNAPKGVAAAGIPLAWLEFHYRKIFPDGSSTYEKNFVPVSKSGHALFAKMGSAVMCNPTEQTLNLAMMCSVVEDAHRANTILASVRDSIELNLPVGMDSYKEIFALRDAPLTSAGRRKAILHWVSSHLRTSINNNEHKVMSHKRGVEEFVIDGLRIRLQPNKIND